MRIFIISAYPTVRAGLRALVREHADWTVAGESSPAALPLGSAPEDAAPSAPTREPVDVVLAELDDAVGAEALVALIQATQPRGGVVTIGGIGGMRAAPALPTALPSVALAGTFGPLGFGLLPRDASAEEIVAAVDAVGHGLVVLDRTAAQAVLASAARADGTEAGSGAVERRLGPGEALTTRELEVLQLLAEGLPNKIIANRLHVSEHTAKFHVASIMTKLGAASRTEAVTQAARRGLLIL